MQSVAEALRAVLARVVSSGRLAVETVALDEAVGRILATDLTSPRALPGFDNSAMDGYAARSADLPAALPIVATIAAGGALPAVPPRTVARILTGAPMPPELDTVVIQEDARVADGIATLPAAPAGDNVRRTGEDIAPGAPVLAAGTRLVPWHAGVLAALGLARVPVARRPRVALIATGDELVDIATEPAAGQLVDSSAHALAALVREAGGVAVPCGIARDDRAAIAALLAKALRECDAIVTTGGVSVGDRDHVHAALGEAGIALELWKVAMKPGKPFSFGTGVKRRRPDAGADRRDDSSSGSDEPAVPVFGLPGNPVSTVVAFELFVRPALLAMQGAAVVERPRAPVRLLGGYAKQAGRAHYLRVHVSREGGELVARAHPKQGSAMLSSLLACNALVEVPAEVTGVPANAIAPAILFEAT